MKRARLVAICDEAYWLKTKGLAGPIEVVSLFMNDWVQFLFSSIIGDSIMFVGLGKERGSPLWANWRLEIAAGPILFLCASNYFIAIYIFRHCIFHGVNFFVAAYFLDV